MRTHFLLSTPISPAVSPGPKPLVLRRAFVLFAAAALLAGCRSVHPQDYRLTSETVRTGNAAGAAQGGPAPAVPAWHSIRIPLRTNLPPIRLIDKFNPVWWFGNADEPNPPAWYIPGHKLRRLRWRLRNSFHNLAEYVIGVGDKETVRSGRYPDQTGNPHGGWNFAVTKDKRLRLPFADYKHGRFEFYIGWRQHGDLGLKLNFRQSRGR